MMLLSVCKILFLVAALAQAAPQDQLGAKSQRRPSLPTGGPWPCSATYHVGKNGGTRRHKTGRCNIPTQDLPQPCLGRFKTPGHRGDCPDSKNISSRLILIF